jgi:hypothetical protein
MSGILELNLSRLPFRNTHSTLVQLRARRSIICGGLRAKPV